MREFQSIIAALKGGKDIPTAWAIQKPHHLTQLLDTLCGLVQTGFARQSRRGWMVVNHPALGQITWKTGFDFRTAGRFLLLRVGGELVLRAWPSPSGRASYGEWMGRAAKAVTQKQKEDFEFYLGYLEV